jgi:hypothetical protein
MQTTYKTAQLPGRLWVQAEHPLEGCYGPLPAYPSTNTQKQQHTHAHVISTHGTHRRTEYKPIRTCVLVRNGVLLLSPKYQFIFIIQINRGQSRWQVFLYQHGHQIVPNPVTTIHELCQSEHIDTRDLKTHT